MAYQVTGTSTQYITATAPVTAAAFTISCWSRFSNTTGDKHLVQISNTATADRFFIYWANQLLSFFVSDSGGFAQPQSVTATSNTWHHCAAVEESAASHWVYLNGTGTQSTTSRTPSGMNGLTIGAQRINNGVSTFTNGNTVGFYQVSKPSKYIRISQGSISNNSHTTINVILYNGSISNKQADIQIPTLNTFSYVAASGGIVNTTPVGLCTAPVGSYLNALFTLNLSNAGLVDTEVLIRSNATVGGGSPTILFRTFLKAGTSQNINFTPALKTVVNQLLEAVTSDTTILYVNAQGSIINN